MEGWFFERVVIIGAGASGMLAAKVASDRGYKVIVLENKKGVVRNYL